MAVRKRNLSRFGQLRYESFPAEAARTVTPGSNTGQRAAVCPRKRAHFHDWLNRSARTL